MGGMWVGFGLGVVKRNITEEIQQQEAQSNPSEGWEPGSYNIPGWREKEPGLELLQKC